MYLHMRIYISFHLEVCISKLEDILHTQLYHLVFIKHIKFTSKPFKDNSDKGFYVEEE